MTTKRTYKTYPRECKEEAVALVNEQGYSVRKVADSLSIRSNILYRWKDQPDAEKAGKVPCEDERAELKRPRKENKDLRMESGRVILRIYEQMKAGCIWPSLWTRPLRRIVGWHIDKRMTSNLIGKVLMKAINLRQPKLG